MGGCGRPGLVAKPVKSQSGGPQATPLRGAANFPRTRRRGLRGTAFSLLVRPPGAGRGGDARAGGPSLPAPSCPLRNSGEKDRLFPALLLPSGFPGYRGSNPDGFLCVVPPPARRQGERDRRVVTSTASRPAARLRAERWLGGVLQAMGHGCGTHLGAVHLETRGVWGLVGWWERGWGGRTELWQSL